MGSIMDQERPWKKEREYYEKQRNCPHTNIVKRESWYYLRDYCKDCGKEMNRTRDPAR